MVFRTAPTVSQTQIHLTFYQKQMSDRKWSINIGEVHLILVVLVPGGIVGFFPSMSSFQMLKKIPSFSVSSKPILSCTPRSSGNIIMKRCSVTYDKTC